MKFAKMQGAGNDFVLVETSDTQDNWAQVAETISDRHFGVGSDGLLLLLPSAIADFRMRIFNNDGSEAEACGNGIRCLARYILEKGLISRDRHQVRIETLAGVREIELLDKVSGDEASIQTSMGAPRLGAKDIPVLIEEGEGQITITRSMLSYPVRFGGRELVLNLVSMGNPHAICFWDKPVADFPLARLGPKVERHRIFPKATNFEVARVLNRKQIEARVWEKGVGETLACGSGSCAIAVAAQLHGYIDNNVDIILPGGVLRLAWDGVGEVLLSGPAEMVFTGEWSG